MTGTQIKFAIDIGRYVRRISPKTPIVWGGIHPTLTAEQTINNPLVDYVIRGEGEKTIVELCKALEKEGDLSLINGLSYKSGNKIYHNKERKYLNFDEEPMPAYRLINMKQYVGIGIQTARGCPHRCAFCFNLFYNKKTWRAKAAKTIIDEIEFLYKMYDIRKIHLVDDNFFVDKNRVKEFCNELLNRNLEVKWSTDCRFDYFDKYDVDFLRLLVKSGCAYLQLAAESGSQKILDLIKKDITIEQIINAVEKCKKAGLLPKIAFMIGMPTETWEDRNKSFDLMNKIKEIYEEAVLTSLHIYTPFPKTDLTKLSITNGFMEPKSLEEWGEFNFNNCNLPWFGKKERLEIESLSYIPRFVFWYKTLEENYITPLLRPLYYVYRIISTLRWKSRLFKFPIEYIFLKKFLEHRTKKKFIN